MSKHAYCIIAHSDQYCLETLLKLLDDSRNDVYLLLDKKSNLIITKLKSVVKISNLEILNPTIDIRWGHISQVKAELELFEAVSESGKVYNYIHLLSGVDLPIKPQDEIHKFFDNLVPGTNLIGFSQGEFNQIDLINKTKYYSIFLRYQRGCNPIIRKLCTLCRITWIYIQKKFGLTRSYPNISKLYKGCNWVSITNEFCNYLVSQKKRLLKLFKGVSCADEIFMQSLIANSQFSNTVFDYKLDFAGATRLIDWERGKPYTWHSDDYDLITKSDCLFARKFSSSIDKGIIDSIYFNIKNNNG